MSLKEINCLSLKQNTEDTTRLMTRKETIKHVVVTGSCDELHTGVQDLKAVQFSKFVHMSGIEEKSYYS